MKARDAARAAQLVQALASLEKLEGVLKHKVSPPDISIGPEDGGNTDLYVVIDSRTANYLVPHIRKEITEELERMGVEL